MFFKIFVFLLDHILDTCHRSENFLIIERLECVLVRVSLTIVQWFRLFIQFLNIQRFTKLKLFCSCCNNCLFFCRLFVKNF